MELIPEKFLKRCTTCRLSKPIDEFPGLLTTGSYMCKGCRKSYNLAYKREHLEATRASVRASGARIRLRRKEATGRTYDRDRYLRRAYDLTEERFKSMLEKQEGKCASCGLPLDAPYVDHDHLTKEVRSLLCDRCNRVLGHAKDDICVLQNLITYLTLMPWRKETV